MNNIENILSISMDKLRGLADANTIVGTPIAMPDGSTIVPVTKVGLGALSGGLDIPTNSPIKKSSADLAEYPFGASLALGVSLSPTAFIVISGDSVRLEPVDYKSSVDRLIDTLVPLANKIIDNCKSKEL